MFLKRSCLLALCLCAVVAQGCRRANESLPDLTLKLEVLPQPARVGLANITIRATDSAGKPVTGARIRLEAQMSHAGMSPVFAEAAELEPGRYVAALELSMAGDWLFIVHLALPGQGMVQREFVVKGVLPA